MTLHGPGAARTVVITGGIGLDGAPREAERAGAAKAIAIEADVADPAAVEAAAPRADDELGPVDVWGNVVGWEERSAVVGGGGGGGSRTRGPCGARLVSCSYHGRPCRARDFAARGER